MKEFIKRIPLVGTLSRKLYGKLCRPKKAFPGSGEYWQERYRAGGNSGSGSYNRLAEFKAEIINRFVKENAVQTIIEYGCGDGNQLNLAEYPSYVGFDVSPKAIELCQDLFRHDSTKTFKLVQEYAGERSQLTLSLDVIYHLVEDAVFRAYMHRLFDSAGRFVIIYSSDFDEEPQHHEKRRRFTQWVSSHQPNWQLVQVIPNRFPYSDAHKTDSSHSDFYIYARTVSDNA
ncbi:MAG: methyltransferase domain-containing protein [Planctomycetota bacterium]|nr:methyltransferase domain-containing protein [Planctomycetota bacterium]